MISGITWHWAINDAKDHPINLVDGDVFHHTDLFFMYFKSLATWLLRQQLTEADNKENPRSSA